MRKKIKRHVNIENLIAGALKDNKQLWYSLSEIAAATGLQVAHIYRVVKTSGQFASAVDTNRMPLISSRERFKKEMPFLRKLIGGLKDRIL